MKVQVEIPLNYLEVFGTASLTGKIVSENMDAPLGEIEEVVLIVHQTTSTWKDKNNGPYLALTPEYVFECLLEDIVNLTGKGIKFKIEHKLVDPK